MPKRSQLSGGHVFESHSYVRRDTKQPSTTYEPLPHAVVPLLFVRSMPHTLGKLIRLEKGFGQPDGRSSTLTLFRQPSAQP